MKWFEVKQLARELRKNQTPEESLVWSNLRNRRCCGVKFYRQHPLKYEQHHKTNFFIADFYSREISLVIELDGNIHQNQLEYDEQRDLIINKMGLHVMRFDNDQIQHSLESVLSKLNEYIKNSPLTPL